RTPDQQQEALANFGRAQKVGPGAIENSKASGNLFQQRASMEALTSVTMAQIDAEKQLQAIRSHQNAGLEKQRVIQQKILGDVRGAVKTLSENSSPLDEHGKLLSDDKLKAQAVKRAEALRTITSSALKGKNTNLTDLLGLAKLNTDLNRTPLRLKFDVEEGIANVESKMRAAFAKLRLSVPVDVGGLESGLGKKFGNPTELVAGIKEAQAKLAELQEQGGRSATAGVGGGG
ncbi:MAG: hypothetical protein ACRD6B_01270, partial [Bryobacteraceae bacterium]